jgi:hypothetical protein
MKPLHFSRESPSPIPPESPQTPRGHGYFP